MSLLLLIGNKTYSSWSLRPWIALRHAGIPFEDHVIPLDSPDTRTRILEHSPAGRVPILVDGTVTVWESMAILEYVAECYPEAGLWPEDRAMRAHARAIANEMHAGFAALRKQFSMNVRKRIPGRVPDAAAEADIARIQEIWRHCRESFGSSGPFLFGAFTAADAMYAPVVTRFETYEIPVDPVSRAYMDAVLGLPAFQEWLEAARSEPWVIPSSE